MTKLAISDLKQVITSSNENQVSISSVEKYDQTSNNSEQQLPSDGYTNDLESNIRKYIPQLYSFNFVNRKPNFFNLNNVKIKDIIKVNKNIIWDEEIDDDQPEKCAQLAKVRRNTSGLTDSILKLL